MGYLTKENLDQIRNRKAIKEHIDTDFLTFNYGG